MPESGRRYRSVIVKFNGVSSSSPVEQLLADDRWVGHLDIDFSGEKLMSHREWIRQEGKQALGRF